MTELNASGVVEDAGFVASFESYRTALAEHGARATLRRMLNATAS